MTLVKSTGILSRMVRTSHVFFSSSASASTLIDSSKEREALQLCAHHSDPEIRERYVLAIVNMTEEHPRLSTTEAYNIIQGARDMHFALYAKKPITNNAPSNSPGCKK